MLRPRPIKNSKPYTASAAESEDSDSVRGLRLSHKRTSNGPKPKSASPFRWNTIVPTQRRERATEGLLLGCAIGEALALPRDNLHPRVALKLFGRNPLHYRFQPGTGITSHRTHGLLMSFQAILRSKTDPQIYATNVSRRIGWYQRGFPIRHFMIHLGRLLGVGKRSDDSMNFGLADDPLIRSLVVSVSIQGTGDSATSWFQKNVSVSHADPRVLHACTLVGHAAQLAQMIDPKEFDPANVLEQLIQTTDEPTLNGMLIQLRTGLKKNRSLAFVATEFGWDAGIPSNVFATAIIGIYGWLRHHDRFRYTVERTILLGGACAGAASIAGGLSGILLGKRGIPSEWIDRLSLYPHGNEWQERLIERIKDWPHGADDIQRVTSLPSMILGQLLRNSLFSAFRAIHLIIRFPMRLTQFSVSKHRSR